MALLATAVIGLLAFLTDIMGDGGAYTWLMNVSGVCGFMGWVSIAWSHYRFRRAYVRQGHSVADLPYRAPLFPIGLLVTLVVLIVVIVGQNYQAVLHGHVVWVVSAYIGLPVFLLVWLIHRLAAEPSGRMVKLAEMDVSGIEVEPERAT